MRIDEHQIRGSHQITQVRHIVITEVLSQHVIGGALIENSGNYFKMTYTCQDRRAGGITHLYIVVM